MILFGITERIFVALLALSVFWFLMFYSITNTQTDVSEQTPQTDISEQTPQTDISEQTPQTDISEQTPQTDISEQTPQTDISEQTPQTDISEQTAQTSILPSFDIVRVDSDGNAVIAGKGAPIKSVYLLANGKPISNINADDTGKFVFLLTIPNETTPVELRLQNAQTPKEKSIESVLILPRPKNETISPTAVIAKSDGEVIVQEQNQLNTKTQKLTLDTINYTQSGDVILSGRAPSEQAIRIYVNNKPVNLGKVKKNAWRLKIPDIKEGLYTLRVDALNKDGEVSERVESPFKRIYPEKLEGQVTIQPNYTLWKLAEIKYGAGIRYIQIFNANRHIIKNPDLIYPGQIFELPD